MSVNEFTRHPIRFCGIDFWDATADDLLRELRQRGGYVVVPAAPALATMREDADYQRALVAADFAILDSGYMAILMALLMRRPVRRISGLKLLQRLFVNDTNKWVRDIRILWVSPSSEETQRCSNYLRRSEFDLNKQTFYQAPFYAATSGFQDESLFQLIQTTKPELIVICIAGGKQEKLAYALRTEFGVTTPMLCTGAAMAFLSGGQVKIPTWADRCFLGWLFRIWREPRTFLPRYLRATWSLPVMILTRPRG